MLLIIDNYDSFTYNLVQYFKAVVKGISIEVYRNDAITIRDIEKKKPKAIILSPGPGTPKDAGISLSVVRYVKGKIPLLGVCLGHQVIAEAYGGTVGRSLQPMHGKASFIYHDGQTIFDGIPSPYPVARYHSLIVERQTWPAELVITAETEEGEVMALRHCTLPIEGVQFHPESILSEHGKKLLRNFIEEYNIC